MLTSYVKNGREAVNMVQIAAGMAVTENRKDITIEDVEWVIHSSQLTPRYEQKSTGKAKSGGRQWTGCLWTKQRCPA